MAIINGRITTATRMHQPLTLTRVDIRPIRIISESGRTLEKYSSRAVAERHAKAKGIPISRVIG